MFFRKMFRYVICPTSHASYIASVKFHTCKLSYLSIVVSIKLYQMSYLKIDLNLNFLPQNCSKCHKSHPSNVKKVRNLQKKNP